MIRVGQPSDKKAIYELYGKSNSFNSGNDESYFAKKYIPRHVLVNEVNGRIVASLQINYLSLKLHNKKVATAYIFGQFNDKAKGAKATNPLINEAIAQQQYKTLVTLIPTNNPNEYNKYGFENVYENRQYIINKNDLTNRSYLGVSKDFTVDEIMQVYNSFTKSFGGYFVRSKDYWWNLIDILQFKRYNLAVFHNEAGVAEGYMIYYIETNKIIAKELVYLNGLALTRLLCYGLRLKTSIIVYASNCEDFSKAFPKVRYKYVTTMVGKVNDLDLFNKLYNCQIQNSKEAFDLEGKSMYLSEEAF